MEKNIVIIDLEKYDELVNEKKYFEKEYKKYKEIVVPTYEKTLAFAQETNEILTKQLVINSLDDYRMENYPLEKLIDGASWNFAIKEEKYKALINLGIKDEYIIQVIEEVKGKEKEDGNE